jgi:hypothetical protein
MVEYQYPFTNAGLRLLSTVPTGSYVTTVASARRGLMTRIVGYNPSTLTFRARHERRFNGISSEIDLS